MTISSFAMRLFVAIASLSGIAAELSGEGTLISSQRLGNLVLRKLPLSVDVRYNVSLQGSGVV